MSLLCPHSVIAVESITPIIIFTSLDRQRFTVQVSSADASGCEESEVAYCAARRCIGFDPSLYRPYVYSNGICFNNVSNFGSLYISCPTATPPYTYNRLTKLCERQGSKELTVIPGPPIIPIGSGVLNRNVLTRSQLVFNLQQGGRPIGGVAINVQSNRGDQDSIDSPTKPTDVAGNTNANISTRNQLGLSTVTASNTDIQTVRPGYITWLPAKYEGEFLITCYALAVESMSPAKPTSKRVCGLPPENMYRNSFLVDVRMQGSGVAENGDIIHYRGSGCYNIDSCARTSVGTCATVGTSIAVDPTVIPRRSSVNVDILGQRIAEDTGGRIKGYHIDDYMGSSRAECISMGSRQSAVTFINY